MANKIKQKMIEKRSEPRFPCVGIELLYSPLDNRPVADVATALLQATMHDITMAGMSFDVLQELDVGQLLLVSVRLPDSQATDTLNTEVRWCSQINEQQYRVGVAITGISTASEHKNLTVGTEYITSGDEVPSGIHYVCPACEEASWFNYIGLQPDIPSTAIMPLYNCTNCHTTRAITSLLSYNRSLAKNITPE